MLKKSSVRWFMTSRAIRTARVLCWAAVSITLVATGSEASGRASGPADLPIPLYSLERAPLEKTARSQASRWLVPDGIEEFLIQVDPATVAANPSKLLIDLPGLAMVEATRTRFVTYRPDWKSWVGIVRYAGVKDERAGYIHLGYHGDQLTALIDFEGERYRIVGGQEEGHRLVKLSDDLSPRSCGLEMPADFLETSGAGEAPPSDPQDKVTSRIDVLVVYPRAFFAPAPTALNTLTTFVQDSISLANDVFFNSNVDAFYNLVGVVPITGTQPPATGLFASLAWLTGQPAEVANLRNAFGADVVALFTPFAWNGDVDACGAANLPLTNNRFVRGNVTINEALGDRAFSSNRVSCGLADFTLGHEIGHNYGMRHDTDNTSVVNHIFPNGRGYVFPVGGQTKSTVMGCHCTGCFCNSTCALGSGAVCNRIPHFSDPAINYLGVATGTADRNNAHAGRSQVAAYAAFRAQSVNTPPFANFTVSCTGRNCSFNASSSSDNAAIPAGGYWWDFGDGTTGTGITPNHNYPNGISFPVHLVVTDSGGQTDVVLNTATPQPIYEGYHENGNCRVIAGWAWDQANPNTPINVDIDRGFNFVTTVAANLFRQDLLNAGKGNGVHGFGYFPDNAWKNGQWHSARVRFSATAFNLTWSPISIICQVSSLTNQTPTENLDTLGVIYTVANQISSANNGFITHLRFYRAPGESGTNTGKLWSNAGTQLAQVTFPASPSSGWVEAALTTPVAITAGTLYRVSVNTNVRQSKTSGGLSSPITNQMVLTAHQGFWIAGNGVFPTNSSTGNYFVDVRFDI